MLLEKNCIMILNRNDRIFRSLVENLLQLLIFLHRERFTIQVFVCVGTKTFIKLRFYSTCQYDRNCIGKSQHYDNKFSGMCTPGVRYFRRIKKKKKLLKY